MTPTPQLKKLYGELGAAKTRVKEAERKLGIARRQHLYGEGATETRSYLRDHRDAQEELRLAQAAYRKADRAVDDEINRMRKKD